MKNKQDILKLHPMIGRLTPMQWDEIHKAMDAYLNEYKTEQLTLTDVSQQRELLLAYNEEINQCMVDSQDILEESDVDEFLANYSG
jgi:hypothetical protein